MAAFSHNGSAVVSLDDDGELNLVRAALTFDVIAGDRIQLLNRLDLRPLIAKERIREKLRASPDLRAAITHAIKLQISAQTGVKDLSLIQVPPALVDEQVARYVADHMTSSAVTETVIRELYLRAALTGKISAIGTEARMLFLETGKLEPVHQIDTDFAANPTQGLYFFAVSQPAIRLNAQLGGRATLYAQASNDRYGAIEDPSGSDAIGFTRDLMSRSSGDILDYSINSQEVGIVQSAPGRSVVFAAGQRPQRDFLTRGELRDNFYGLARYRAALSDFNLQLQGSLEGANDAESVKRANFILSRPLIRGRAAVGTQLFVREGGDQPRLLSWLTGANLRFIRTANFDFGGGVKYSRFKVGDATGYRAEAGIGMGWIFR